MVDFGLKLQDNQVSDWRQYYIAYEVLKALLTKAKQAASAHSQVAKQEPLIAIQVKKDYEEQAGLYPSEAIATRGNDPLQVANSYDFSDLASPLLGSKANTSIADSMSEVTASDSATSTKTGRQLSNYEKKVCNALKEVERTSADFDQQIEEELEKVNRFYFSKLEELEDHLSHLIESVKNSLKRNRPQPHNIGSHFEGLDDKESVNNTLPSHFASTSSYKPTPTDLTVDGLRIIEDVDLWEDEDAKLQGFHGNTLQLSEADSIQRATIDLYRTAALLHNFAIMNYAGFVKIVKKHDKVLPHRKNRLKIYTKFETVCSEGKRVELLSHRISELYANWFCDGNIHEANAQLLHKKVDELDTDWSQIRLGFRLGMCAILGMWICWDSIWGTISIDESSIGARVAFPVYRACLGLLALQWFWGVSTLVWTRYRINYIYLFDFDPRIVGSPMSILNDAVDNTFIYLLSMLLYFKAGAHDMPELCPPGLYPFVLVCLTVFKLVFPVRLRLPLWKTLWRVFTAPCTSPSFFDTYVGDIFTSMVKVFQDIAWTICYACSGHWLLSEDTPEAVSAPWASNFWYTYVIIPIICFFPLFIRFNQCLRKYSDTRSRFPHLANAAKYSLSQLVTLFGAFHPLYLHYQGRKGFVAPFQIFWVSLFVSSSMYSFGWDVYMDWGLGRSKYSFLGPQLMFPERRYYYMAMAQDFVLRFLWVLTLLPPDSGASFQLPSYLIAAEMILELTRRTIWGFFRLENEHRSNAMENRRIKFVPLHFSTGHDHKYTNVSEHRGKGVLVEILVVCIVVLGLSVYSIFVAEHGNGPEL